MILIPIHQNQNLNSELATDPDCLDILDVYPSFYEKIGFNPPWIGYFAFMNNKIVGGGGFKGKPKDGRVEIAYTTFSIYEGQGIGTKICGQLVSLSLETDPEITIAARTILPDNASSVILSRNGFECVGQVWDEEDGNVWEWIYKKL
ncbi:N-acetyltransferase [Dyadobacter sp. NIV53]|uniref:N-acetyltransferase n=1 Tax=Dyadobacter sp. NIV53 TaxID=2861765 RepID=UPI001C868FBC|nr:N-acetyltransferase [Dyadobacter sp. NIV53]